LAGIVVDGGKFDWEGSGKFPNLVEPDESYHGISYTQFFGKSAYIAKARAQILRDFGCVLSPFNAFMIMQGIETLSLRMKQHSENAMAVAKFLQRHKNVAWVNYPGLEKHPNYELAKRVLALWWVLGFMAGKMQELNLLIMLNCFRILQISEMQNLL
jgi:O-acetylhomoserine (thiol)-lyase